MTKSPYIPITILFSERDGAINEICVETRGGTMEEMDVREKSDDNKCKFLMLR